MNVFSAHRFHLDLSLINRNGIVTDSVMLVYCYANEVYHSISSWWNSASLRNVSSHRMQSRGVLRASKCSCKETCPSAVGNTCIPCFHPPHPPHKRQSLTKFMILTCLSDNHVFMTISVLCKKAENDFEIHVHWYSYRLFLVNMLVNMFRFIWHFFQDGKRIVF